MPDTSGECHAVGSPNCLSATRNRRGRPWVIGVGLIFGSGVIPALRNMNQATKLATIECSTCSVLLEVYPQNTPGQPSLGWNALEDGQLCKVPPLKRCPHARTAVKLRFPGVDL